MRMHRFGLVAVVLGVVLLAGCSGSIGSACDSKKEATTNQACQLAKGTGHATACSAAADADGSCAAASTGFYHYSYLFKQATETGLAGAYSVGKARARREDKAMRIFRSIANDPQAPAFFQVRSAADREKRRLHRR
jgi:hypothetical protein